MSLSAAVSEIPYCTKKTEIFLIIYLQSGLNQIKCQRGIKKHEHLCLLKGTDRIHFVLTKTKYKKVIYMQFHSRRRELKSILFIDIIISVRYISNMILLQSSTIFIDYYIGIDDFFECYLLLRYCRSNHR